MKIFAFLNQNNNARAIFTLLLMSCLCGLLAILRVYMTHKISYLFLLWNLFLAWIPLIMAYFHHQNYFFSNKKNIFFLCSTAFLWLLFFPNAPYIVTDLVHLNHKLPYIPFWFDTLLLFSFALAGLTSGYLSLYLIHSVIKDRLTDFTSWLIIGFLLSLSSFGIYLGRVLRANSWDLFTGPMKLIKKSIFSLNDPAAISMTLMFSFFLLFSYLILYSIINMNPRRI
jgi:uncharacterized membrane protein